METNNIVTDSTEEIMEKAVENVVETNSSNTFAYIAGATVITMGVGALLKFAVIPAVKKFVKNKFNKNEDAIEDYAETDDANGDIE